MNKRKKPFGFSKKLMAMLVSLMLIFVGVTAFAATGGLETTVAALTGSNSSDVEYTTVGGSWTQVDDKTWKHLNADGEADDITLVKNGDEWEYLFTVQDDTADYYGWEDAVPTGYEVDGKGERANPATNIDSADFSITNTETDYEQPDYGAITLKKVIAGDAADANQNFKFTITLSSSDTTIAKKLSGNVTFGDTSFTDGVATVYLKGGESVSLTDIPATVEYKISEEAVSGYTTTISGGTASSEENTVTGTITKDTTDEVTYTNTKESSGGGEDPSAPTGSFKLKKVTVNGTDTDEFSFAAALTNLSANTDYTITITKQSDSAAEVTEENITATSNAAGIAYVELQLKNGETAEFKALPIGSKYQIKEASSDYTASFEITDEADENNLIASMSRKENFEANQELSTANETLDENEQALITFTNSKPEVKEDAVNIEVTKNWVDDGNSGSTRPENITVRLYQSTDESEDGDMIATAQLDNDSEWKTTFAELDKTDEVGNTYYYTVKEDAVTGYETTIAKDDSTGNFTITNTLSNVKTGDLLLSKTIDGHNADESKEFRFDITILDKDAAPLEGTYVLDSDKGTKTGTIYFDSEGCGTISLKGGESAYIVGLPEGTTYTVKETSYTDWTASLLDDTTLTGTIKADETSNVSVKNTYVEKHELTVSKTVTGSMGDKTKDFSFELSLTPADGTTIPETLTYEKDGAEATVTKSDDVYSFTLSHGESITFKNIPYGCTYTVSEKDGVSNGYTVTSDKPSGTIEDDTAVTFTNTKNGTVPTLADMNVVIPLILVIAGIAGLIAVKFGSRKKGNASK